MAQLMLNEDCLIYTDTLVLPNAFTSKNAIQLWDELSLIKETYLFNYIY